MLGQANATAADGSHVYRVITTLGLATLAVLTLAYKLDIGFVSISIGLVLTPAAPNLQKRALGQVSWPEIMLIVGVSTYVGVMEKMGTINFVGDSVARPHLAAGGRAAAVLRRRGGLGLRVLDRGARLADPARGAVPAGRERRHRPIGFIAAMAVSSTIVDVSPFSTNGALVLANAKGVDRDRFFRQLMLYGAVVTVIAPVVVWLLFVVL